MPSSRTGKLIAFVAVFAATAVFALAMAFVGHIREAASITLMIPLLWAYMLLPPGAMIASAVIVSCLRVAVETIQHWQRGVLTARDVAEEVVLPILLYVALGVVFHLYRRRQATLVRKLVDASSLEARSRMAASLVHDFNNILSIISGTAGLLAKDHSLNAGAAKDVNAIATAANQGAELVRQMRQSAPGGQRQLALVNLNDVLERQLDLMSRMLEPTVKLVRQLSDAPLPVRLDVRDLLRIVLNLSLNARDAMPVCGILAVRTASTYIHGRPFAEILFSDTGTGMDRQTLGRLFEPFFTTKAAQGGVGLGLSIAQAIIKDYGGTIEADSEKGKGATLRILLPLVGGDSAGVISGQA